MGMRCCDTLAKILLVTFNALFLACGLAILGVGIWIKSDPQFSNLGNAIKVGTAEPIVEIVTWTFIGIGIFVFAIAFAGLIGTIRESKIIMGFYLVCVFIVFLAEASAGIYAGIRRNYLIEKIESEAAIHLRDKYAAENEELLTQGVNYLQQKFECCGVKSFMDYKNSTFLKVTGNKIKANATMSWSCCQPSTILDNALKSNGEMIVDPESREICMDQSIAASLSYSEENADMVIKTCGNFEPEFIPQILRCKGCSTTLQEWAKEHMYILLGVGVGVGALQLVLMFLALWFCQSLGKYEKKAEVDQ